jgi:hypothetical protein
MSVSSECCVLSRRGLCEELITRPEEVLPTVVRRYVWSKILMNEEAIPRVGPRRTKKKNAALTAKITKYLMRSGDDHKRVAVQDMIYDSRRLHERNFLTLL